MRRGGAELAATGGLSTFAAGASIALLGSAVVGIAVLGTACSKSGDGGPSGTVCPAGEMACAQQCLDVAADPLNCGGCGIPCATDQVCRAGACQCLSGTLCNGVCLPAAEAGSCPGGAEGTLGSPPLLITSAPGAYWMTTGVLTEAADASADVVIDTADGSLAQTWEGFGGAFNERGWNVLSLLSPQDRDAAIHLLYGADGARFAFGRIPIGANDYAMDRYTLDETAGPTVADTALAGFSIDRDMQRVIPYVKAVQAVKPNLRLWASPWTPPTWMKQPPFQPGAVVSPFDGGFMKNDAATMTAFAAYLIAFVQAYAAQGIAIEALSPQNEPSYVGNYPTCGWSPATYTTFVGQYLGPAVTSAGLTTKIMLGTFNGGGSDSGIVGAVMGDALARSTVAVLGFQWGMQDKVGAARSFNLPIWQTEHRCGNYPWATPFNASAAPNDQAYAVESWRLIRDWIRAGVTAYSAWNMVLDTVGVGIDTTRVWPQNALLTVDTSAGRLIVTPSYYVFRHLSQFVFQGARLAKVASGGGDTLAFKNPDGSVVAVMYNSGAARTMTVAAAGKKLQFAMPGNGWASVITR